MNQAEEVYVRIKDALNAKNDSEVARFLGITQQSVAGALKRNRIPSEWVRRIAEEHGISSEWLFFGRGPVHSVELSKSIAPFKYVGDDGIRDARQHIVYPIDSKTDEIKAAYRKIAVAFLGMVFDELRKKPDPKSIRGMLDLLTEELAFKLRPRFIDHIRLLKYIEESDQKEPEPE